MISQGFKPTPVRPRHTQARSHWGGFQLSKDFLETLLVKSAKNLELEMGQIYLLYTAELKETIFIISTNLSPLVIRFHSCNIFHGLTM